MTRSLNKVMLIGNLAGDPSLKTTSNGKSLCRFVVVTNRDWVDSENNRKEVPEFHSVITWAKLAENCANILHVGDRVYIEGRIQSQKYTDKAGVDKVSVDVIANEMILLPRGQKQYGNNNDSGEELL